MNYRRCHAVAVLPEEKATFSLNALISGGSGLEYERCIRVYAAHLDTVCTLEVEACMLLLSTSAEQWRQLPEDVVAREQVLKLVELGLLVLDVDAPGNQAHADLRVRENHWWPLSAIHYRHSRWDGVDSAGEMERSQMLTAKDLVRKLGVPPSEAPDRQAGALALPRVVDDSMDRLLESRVTCRNFDVTRPLALVSLAAMLQDVLMSQAVVESEPGACFLKKNVPSGGGLHPTEAYVVVRDVAGLAAGVYHYHAVAHELARIEAQPDDLDGFSQRLLAGQHWFANAPAMVVLVCRFERNFWKYRRHVKAYRAVTLDAGHISQAFYTAATKHGLGAFVTAAINEVEMEKVLALDPMEYGTLAVCGFGWRAPVMSMAELDPAHRVWRSAPAA